MNNIPEIKGNKDCREYWIFLFILTALSLFMVCWFGPISEFSGHDYYFNIGRFNVLIDALKSGSYPIYIDYNALEGYGYFTKGFYPDLIILPFAAIGIITGVGTAYHVMIFTMTFLCGLFSYHAVNTILKNPFAAAASAILYTFSAYHLFDWYNRAALGESISFTFLPIVFLGFYHIVSGNPRKWYLLTIGYSLLIYTHLLSTFLATVTLGILLLFCRKPLIKEPKRIAYLLLAVAVTLPLISSYLLPLLEQMASNTFYYNQHENITGQTKLSLSEIGWGMLSGVAYPASKNIAGVGPILIVLVLLRLFIKEKSKYLRIADLCAIIGLAYILVMSFIFPWGRLPLGFIQFPWRLYEFVVLFFAVAGGYYLSILLKTKRQYIVAASAIILFTIVVFVVNNNNYKRWQTIAKNAVPEWFTGVPALENEYYLGRMEYLPVKVPLYEFIHQRRDSIKSSQPNTYVSNLIKDKGITSFDVRVSSSDNLELPLIYYKGYKVVQNGKELPVMESDYGLVQTTVAEPGNVEVFYSATAIQKISWYISLISAFSLCIFIYISKKKRNKAINDKS